MYLKKKIKFVSLSSVHTIGIGFFLSKFIKYGSCIMLNGELASGKTTFVKGVVHGLKVKKAEYVNSPTYSLVNKYSGKVSLYHIDLYRLNGYYELTDLGLMEIIFSDQICLVEWAEKIITSELPEKTIQINFFKSLKNKRLIEINCYLGV